MSLHSVNVSENHDLLDCDIERPTLEGQGRKKIRRKKRRKMNQIEKMKTKELKFDLTHTK